MKKNTQRPAFQFFTSAVMNMQEVSQNSPCRNAFRISSFVPRLQEAFQILRSPRLTSAHPHPSCRLVGRAALGASRKRVRSCAILEVSGQHGTFICRTSRACDQVFRVTNICGSPCPRARYGRHPIRDAGSSGLPRGSSPGPRLSTSASAVISAWPKSITSPVSPAMPVPLPRSARPHWCLCQSRPTSVSSLSLQKILT